MESQGHGLYLIDGHVRMHLTHRFTDLGCASKPPSPSTLNQVAARAGDVRRQAHGVRRAHLHRWAERKSNILFDQNNEPFHKKNTPIRVGAGGGLSFDGGIRDARIYKRALTPEEAAARFRGRADVAEIAAIPEDQRTQSAASASSNSHFSEPRRAESDTTRAISSNPRSPNATAFYDQIPTVMVMADGAHRDTFLAEARRLRCTRRKGDAGHSGGAAAAGRRSVRRIGWVWRSGSSIDRTR